MGLQFRIAIDGVLIAALLLLVAVWIARAARATTRREGWLAIAMAFVHAVVLVVRVVLLLRRIR